MNWWGGAFSYTWSHSKDNQFGESNTYAWRTATPQNNYDLNAEYATSIYDSPHRIILAPIVRLAVPEGSATAWPTRWPAAGTRRRSSNW